MKISFFLKKISKLRIFEVKVSFFSGLLHNLRCVNYSEGHVRMTRHDYQRKKSIFKEKTLQTKISLIEGRDENNKITTRKKLISHFYSICHTRKKLTVDNRSYRLMS